MLLPAAEGWYDKQDGNTHRACSREPGVTRTRTFKCWINATAARVTVKRLMLREMAQMQPHDGTGYSN